MLCFFVFVLVDIPIRGKIQNYCYIHTTKTKRKLVPTKITSFIIFTVVKKISMSRGMGESDFIRVFALIKWKIVLYLYVCRSVYVSMALETCKIYTVGITKCKWWRQTADHWKLTIISLVVYTYVNACYVVFWVFFLKSFYFLCSTYIHNQYSMKNPIRLKLANESDLLIEVPILYISIRISCCLDRRGVHHFRKTVHHIKCMYI